MISTNRHNFPWSWFDSEPFRTNWVSGCSLFSPEQMEPVNMNETELSSASVHEQTYLWSHKRNKERTEDGTPPPHFGITPDIWFIIICFARDLWTTRLIRCHASALIKHRRPWERLVSYAPEKPVLWPRSSTVPLRIGVMICWMKTIWF